MYSDIGHWRVCVCLMLRRRTTHIFDLYSNKVMKEGGIVVHTVDASVHIIDSIKSSE